MPLLVNQIYSKEDGGWLYGYDLGDDKYLGARYIVAHELDLAPFSHNDALLKLYEYRGHIYRFDNKDGFLKMFNTNRSGDIKKPK